MPAQVALVGATVRAERTQVRRRYATLVAQVPIQVGARRVRALALGARQPGAGRGDGRGAGVDQNCGG